MGRERKTESVRREGKRETETQSMKREEKERER